MGRVRRKRMHKNIKDFKKKCRTRKRTKDLDQIHEDLKPENAEKLAKLTKDSGDMDLPGAGQYYCIHCAVQFFSTIMKKYQGESMTYIYTYINTEHDPAEHYQSSVKFCINSKALDDHMKSKLHKRRLRLLREKPYTQEEAEMAAGMGSYTISPKIPEQNLQKIIQMDSSASTADESLMSP